MTRDELRMALWTLYNREPNYQELAEIHRDMRKIDGDESIGGVCKLALSQILSEILDYLDFVADDLEKSVGITRDSERTRILSQFENLPEDDVRAITHLYSQWLHFDQYSLDEIMAEFE